MATTRKRTLQNAVGLTAASALLILGVAACGPENETDTTPPEFSGADTVEITGVGQVRLTWQPAVDSSLPITYEVYHANDQGQQNYLAAPLATVQDATELVVHDLHPGAGLRHFFIVRARDAADNLDANKKELDVIFQENGIEVMGQYIMGLAADLAIDAAREIAVVSAWFNEEIHIVDVTQKASPMLISSIQNLGYGADVQLKDTWLYASHEGAGRGFDIYDIADASNPTLVKQVGPQSGYPASLEDCHNLWPQPDRDLLYCASTTTGELVVMSTGDGAVGAPDDPVFLAALGVPGDYGIHDMYAHGNRLYAAFLDAGLFVYDITDPTTPVELGSKVYSRAFTHNIWPNKDDTIVYTSDENERGHMRVWDISDLSDIQQIGEYQPNERAIIHNVEVVDNYAYIAYYVEGLKVVDVSDPTNPREVGSHDFYFGSDNAGFRGAWGVDPHPPYVYVSGMETGMWIHRFTPPDLGPPAANGE